MTELRSLLEEAFDEKLNMIVISRSRNKSEVSRIKYRPVLIKKELVFQESKYVGTKVIHANLNKAQAVATILSVMEKDYVQIEIVTDSLRATGLVNRKGEMALKVKRSAKIEQENEAIRRERLSHNKKKRYILNEGEPIGFLIDLGVMSKDGKIINSRYDKFRQINRFLEFVEDILEGLDKKREVRIIDFGCGKSYLTFALYYYMKIKKGYDIRVTGLDLKEDVIEHCNKLTKKYGYDKLDFICGDIKDYTGDNRVDMVVTLHACNTATDYALYKAVGWGASVILSVPCCQHELNEQMDSKLLSPVIGYGLIKERMAALFTDGIRAELLKEQGYDVSILEFIDMEHTPKNILIRAIKTGKKQKRSNELTALIEELNVEPTLLKLME